MQKIIDYLHNRWFHKWVCKTKDYQHDRKHVIRHSRRQYFENNFLPRPPPFVPYTLIYYYTFCRSYWGGGPTRFSPPPPQSEVLGAPRPDYTILYDDAFRAKVIGGWVDLIGEIAKKRRMYQGCRSVLSVRNFAIEPLWGENRAIEPTPWGRKNAIISSA